VVTKTKKSFNGSSDCIFNLTKTLKPTKWKSRIAEQYSDEKYDLTFFT